MAYALAERTGPVCNVELIKWVDYKRAMLSGRGDMWDALWNADLIMGGLMMEADFMYAITNIFICT